VKVQLRFTVNVTSHFSERDRHL